MQVGSGEHTYQWIEDWAHVPDSESARSGWSHHGIVVSETGNIIAFHQADTTILEFDPDGNLVRSSQTDLTEAHGMTLVKEGDTEYLWIADNGRKRAADLGYEYGAESHARVVKTTLSGEIVMSLDQPDLAVYETGMYSPTWVAVNDDNGDVWVADGYGQSHVHRYDSDGNYISSINGTEGEAGAFDCPHAIFIDQRKPEAELYVADRSNGRVQVYDLEGNFKRVFGSDFLTSPSGFVTDGDLMVIAELRARLTITDTDDQPVAYLGDNEQVCDVGGWPNNLNDQGTPVRTSLLEQGKFNSPHGMAIDADGNLFVAEWLIGGRFIKLAKS